MCVSVCVKICKYKEFTDKLSFQLTAVVKMSYPLRTTAISGPQLKMLQWRLPVAMIGQYRGQRCNKQPVGEVIITVYTVQLQTDGCSPSVPEATGPPRTSNTLWTGQSCRWPSGNIHENAICVLLCARRWRSRMEGILLRNIRRAGEWSWVRTRGDHGVGLLPRCYLIGSLLG